LKGRAEPNTAQRKKGPKAAGPIPDKVTAFFVILYLFLLLLILIYFNDNFT
jgi:hypothetical protein